MTVDGKLKDLGCVSFSLQRSGGFMEKSEISVGLLERFVVLGIINGGGE